MVKVPLETVPAVERPTGEAQCLVVSILFRLHSLQKQNDPGAPAPKTRLMTMSLPKTKSVNQR